MPLVEVRGLRVDYDAVTAVSDLSFSLDAGTIYGLIGPNGAGKTTTLRVLATLLEPTYGDIFMDGHDIREHPDRVHAILGFMPDGSPLYDDLTVEETMRVFASAYRIPIPQREQAVRQVLELTDLTHKHNWYVSTLSKGMKQRCLLAKTLLHDPKVLLLDEPANGLDPMARIELREVLKSLGQMGKAILISSHILTELSDFCNAVGIMERGRMRATGKTEEIAQRLAPGLTFRVELLAPEPRVADLVRQHPKVVAVAPGERDVTFTIQGTDEDAHDILKGLIGEGVRVRTFTEQKMDLEDIFMRIGAREVS
jgi:ABC-2 type transport system ATP-binding protein